MLDILPMSAVDAVGSVSVGALYKYAPEAVFINAGYVDVVQADGDMSKSWFTFGTVVPAA
jgi:hypothetical protein